MGLDFMNRRLTRLTATDGIEKIPGGGITSPSGFKAVGVYCGVKKENSTNKDLALIYSEEPAAVAGVFTKNLFRAAPILVCQERMGNSVRAIVTNSGNANACVGEAGYRDALEMGEVTAKQLNIPEESVMVASTGVIGQKLPLAKIKEGIVRASAMLTESPEGGDSAAQAILTTDTTTKKVAYRGHIAGKSFVVGGIAKGSGMICPNMATMLAYITTDLCMDEPLLQKAFSEAVKHSFNLISVDGETSTNDMAMVLANGCSGIRIEKEGPEYKLFQRILSEICRDLACMIVRDGEGITKLIALTVKGAPGYDEARKLALAVLNSVLVKTAFFGEDANWGRIFGAMGYSGVQFDPKKIDLYLGPVKVASGGQGVEFSEEEVSKYLKEKEIPITIDLHSGNEEILAWGNDLSYEYVRINSDYRN